tara:strand:- start:153 stop:713 length:561 start_codon:yes stop_codon:yes gene_type:complete
MRIFFLGGTFDPPHLGHMKIVECCIDKCDKFILIPAKKSPHKKNNPIANSIHRINMLNLIFKKNKKVFIDDFEVKSEVINYTYITIQYLKNKYKNAILTMIVGYDQLLNLNNWKNSSEILKSVNILGFNRNLGKNKKKLNLDNIQFINNFRVNISSSIIREKINISEQFLDKKILRYIEENELYAN